MIDGDVDAHLSGSQRARSDVESASIDALHGYLEAFSLQPQAIPDWDLKHLTHFEMMLILLQLKFFQIVTTWRSIVNIILI